MAIIAVAGGTSPTLGRSIVTAIAKTCNRPVILSRKSNPEKAQPSHYHGVEVRYVDYNSQDSIVGALSGVETVISVLKVPGPEWVIYQTNLIQAAKAAGVKRFAPSEFGLGPHANGVVDVLSLKIPVWAACEESGLECAQFCCGGFMNYLAIGDERVNSEEKKDTMLHGLVDEPIIWDSKSQRAELPVTEGGKYPRVTMTEIGDVGKFVAAACELPLGTWKPTMGMAGDTIGVDEILKLLEDSSGNKFAVSQVTPAELKERAAKIEGIGTTREEILEKMVSQMVMVMTKEQEGYAIIDPVVNRLCSSVKPCSIVEYLKRMKE